MRKLMVVALSLILFAVAAPVSAGTNPNRASPPRLTLRYKGEVVQQSRPYTFCWSQWYPDGGGSGMCADGFPRYKKAARVNAPARLAIRIHYPVKPTEWDLHAYRAISRREHWDEAVGPAQRIPFRWRAHRVDGRVRAWDVVFRVEEPLRHYYIETGGQLSQGDAYYVLHVRT